MCILDVDTEFKIHQDMRYCLLNLLILAFSPFPVYFETQSVVETYKMIVDTERPTSKMDVSINELVHACSYRQSRTTRDQINNCQLKAIPTSKHFSLKFMAIMYKAVFV